MRQTLLFLFLFITLNNYSQTTNLIEIPEVWEIDFWNGSNWSLTSQTTFTFNNSCLPTEGLSKFVDFGGSNTLENASFLTITYNTNNLPTESINHLWNEDSNTWEDQLKTEFIHTGTNLTESINYDWLNDDWELSNRELNTFNTSNLITETISQNRNETNTAWVNISRTENTYNPNETLNIITTYTWNTTNNTWVNNTRETHTYTGNKLTTEESDSWNGSAWENDRFRNYTYDSNDFLIEILETKWNGSTYENENRTLRTNNTDGFPTEMITQSWFLGTWTNGSRDRRTYPDCESLSTKKITKEAFSFYPNPANSSLTINFKTKGLISIIDLNGRILKTLNIKDNIHTLDTSKMANGIYHLIFKNHNIQEVKRLIINR
ncbi:T9SS type A sorting domain-containing protein [Algibacter sp. PT7-4]|uniref:T9SS type A sorting domain-containing protein n=1 Tax=Algibacter ulvanivorans TaxID=3400999 RepID=UPI003AAA7FB8